MPLLAHISVETYSRLLLLDLLPKDLDKILWLDADIVINNNIDELYNQELGKNYAAVCESINDNASVLLKKLELDLSQKYFNAGVILFNLKQLRKDFSNDYFIEYASKNLDKITWLDQDILNATIGHNCSFIDYKKYNLMHFSNTKFSKEEKQLIKNSTIVLHYIGNIKPWDYKFVGYTKDFWLKYAKKSKAYSNFFFLNMFIKSKLKSLKSLIKKALKKLLKPIKVILNSIKNVRLHAKYKNVNILSCEETIEYIIKNKSSVSRFGDGEMLIIDNESDIGFQEKDENLSQSLRNVLDKKTETNMLICIPRWIFKKEDLRKRTKKSQKWCKKYLNEHLKTWCNKINKNELYGDTSFNRNYIGLKNKAEAVEIFNKLKRIWEGRNVCFIEGDLCYLGIGNDLFDNAKSIKRIIAPAKSAFNKYKEILSACKALKKDTLFLIALGPTATVLAYDLYKEGYQAIDIGHIDIEYEWCNMKATEVVQVKNKFTNEAGNSNSNITRIKDEKYESQIIKRI